MSMYSSDIDHAISVDFGEIVTINEVEYNAHFNETYEEIDENGYTINTNQPMIYLNALTTEPFKTNSIVLARGKSYRVKECKKRTDGLLEVYLYA